MFGQKSSAKPDGRGIGIEGLWCRGCYPLAGGAGLWAYSSSLEIRDNINKIVGDLQRAAYWNSWAARVACVAAIASCVYAVCDALR